MFSDVSKFENKKNLGAIIDFFRSIKLDAQARDFEKKMNELK